MKRTAAVLAALYLALCLAGCGNTGGSANGVPETPDNPGVTETGENGTGEQPVTEEPSGAETPSGTEEPSSTETPSGTEEPSGAETPSNTEEPSGAETPSGTEEPSGAETPSGTEEPSGAETPSGAEGNPQNAESMGEGGDSGAQLQEEYVVPSDSDIKGAVIAHNHEFYPDSEFEAASYVVYATGGVLGDDSTSIVYAMTLFQGYDFPDGKPEMVCASSGPAALTFRRTADGFQLTEYWEPEDGEGWMPSLREKFPSTIPDEDFDTQQFIQRLMADCDAQAEAYAQSR